MLIKTIICEVEQEHQSAFSTAQEEWNTLRHVEGFHGQVGGWDGNEACIFSVWEHMNAYQNFMNNIHDAVLERGQQQLTYTSCKTTLYQSLFSISNVSFTHGLGKCSFIRVAICDVEKGKEDQFLHIQETVWNEGMNKQDGMLGGIVGKSVSETNRFIVISLWEDEEAHQKYVDGDFTYLYRQANVSEYTISIQGKQVPFVREWVVI
ncbi:antibiotic biosynthesis monooxygenase [Bacillus manliponensis]|uniref:Antibiotic biosynthesis monooxygenase n=1 Tax=Bacillus manliponensis TaxID=574376 RepID=A0A073JSX9_9BACI|nr:DUF4937 domain-containing protein [Bacillus manliponensis]KEK18189.1 antibiotic biosynthesis monooxygenase [Bacillus manliponensis]